MRVSEAFESFVFYYLVSNDRSEKTVKEYRGRILGKNGLVPVVGDIAIETLGVDHIMRWKLHMRDEGLQAVYINHCMSGLRWFLKWLQENEMSVLDWHKVTFDKEELHKPKTLLTPQEVSRLIDSAPKLRDKAIIDLFFGTGMRSAELLSLDRVDWEQATLVNPGDDEPIWEINVMGKNKKYRPVHFYQGVKQRVDDYLYSRTDRYRPLFVSLQNRRISYSMISRMLHDTSRKAGLQKIVTQHVFRHSNATELAVNGMPIPVLAAHLGHKDGVVTQRIYTNEITMLQTRQSYSKYYGSLKTKP